MKLSTSIKFALVASAASYLCTGAYIEAQHKYNAKDWPFIEIERLLDLVNYYRMTDLLQRWLATLTIHLTGANIEAIDASSIHETPAVRAWLSTMHEAELTGALAAVVTAPVVLILAGGIYQLGAWRLKSKSRRALARKTAAPRLTGERRRQIVLAGVPLPEGEKYEPHLLVAARTGQGKSVALNELVTQLRNLGVSGFVVDYEGEQVKRHWRKGDLLFNPLDCRGFNYSFLIDATNELHCDSVALAAFPPSSHPVHGYFQDSGRGIFSEALAVCNTNLELWRALGDRQLLIEKLKQTPAGIYIDKDTREATSYITTMMTRLRCLSYFPASAGRNYKTKSLRAIVRAARAKPGQFCFFVIPEEAHAALTPIVNIVCSIVISELLSLPELAPGDDWRFLLSTDELGQIERIDNFDRALTNGRKKGIYTASCVQHIEQFNRIYGAKAKEICSSFGTKLVLGQGDTESAEFWSREIGATEIREWRRTQGESRGDGRNNTNSGKSENIRMRPRVLPHELRELPKLNGYLLIGQYPAVSVELQVPSNQPTGLSDTFIPRTGADEPTAGEALRKELAALPAAVPLPPVANTDELNLSALDSNKGPRA